MEININIRKGQKGDLQSVLNLVKELAIYEKEPYAVTATLDEYIELFENNWYDILLAENQSNIIGIAIFYRSFSTWKGRMLYLEDLVVSQKHRGKGIGRLLFEAVVDRAKTENCALLKWQVLDWNEPALKFYGKNECPY